MPPSTFWAMPLMPEAASEERNMVALAISSVVRNRWMSDVGSLT